MLKHLLSAKTASGNGATIGVVLALMEVKVMDSIRGRLTGFIGRHMRAAGRWSSSRGSVVDVQLIPEDPRDAGLSPVKLTIEEIEPAHLLANEARVELRRIGFTDDEIDGWAREFVARQGAGDAEELLAWTAREEQFRSGSVDQRGQAR